MDVTHMIRYFGGTLINMKIVNE